MIDVYKNLNQILNDVASVKEEEIINTSFSTQNLTLIKIRDVLLKIGKIQREMLDDGVYVAVIPSGFLKKNYAVIALRFVNDEVFISAYADEGIIKQHTSEGAINEFKKNIKEFITE